MPAAASPPMITHASGEYSGERCTASGSTPPIAVSDVSTMGRKRTSPARRIAADACSRAPVSAYRRPAYQRKPVPIPLNPISRSDCA